MIGPLEKLQALIASTEAWQTICGVDNAEDAAARIVFYGWECKRPAGGEESDAREPAPVPLIVMESTNYNRAKVATSTYRANGGVLLVLDFARPDEPTVHDEYKAVGRQIQDLFTAMVQASKANGAFEIGEFGLSQLRLAGPTKQEAVWTIEAVIEWPATR
jgi:hypothetical protein